MRCYFKPNQTNLIHKPEVSIKTFSSFFHRISFHLFLGHRKAFDQTEYGHRFSLCSYSTTQGIRLSLRPPLLGFVWFVFLFPRCHSSSDLPTHPYTCSQFSPQSSQNLHQSLPHVMFQAVCVFLFWPPWLSVVCFLLPWFSSKWSQCTWLISSCLLCKLLVYMTSSIRMRPLLKNSYINKPCGETSCYLVPHSLSANDQKVKHSIVFSNTTFCCLHKVKAKAYSLCINCNMDTNISH